ncbi:hypothetical protein NEPTK9_001631 [Candidatus Neptunochlamydia vexilliferae]|uniref:Uncharacterized protein n=1 Tax=Candidatus Neptunichlamydia vexilliferae TaxID=1651774 RepID=A0ABS0B137_9BACT|nr:hypothetical protein [Candidatus Neptunochlamydia vexilliferae]
MSVTSPRLFIGFGGDEPLVPEGLEGLRCRNITCIIEHLMPKASIKKVENSMFDSPHIHIDRHPILFFGLSPRFVFALGITKAEVVPARAGPLGHRVGFSKRFFSCFGVGDLDPLGDIIKRGFPLPLGFVIGEVGKG